MAETADSRREAGCRRRSFSAEPATWNEERTMRRPLEESSPVRRRIDYTVEMPKFDGVGHLELFLQRFRTLAEYYKWPTSEQLFRMKQCVQADAQLWTRLLTPRIFAVFKR